MQEALKKSIEDEEQAKDVDIVSIYDHLSYSEYKVNLNHNIIVCMYSLTVYRIYGVPA